MSNLTHYLCPSCKSEFIKLSEEKSIICPYCEYDALPQESKTEEGLSDFIIPFKVKKEDAVKEFKKISHEVPFLPKEIENFDAQGEIRGLYIPFWLFDGKCNAKLSYHAQKIINRRSFFARIPHALFKSYSLYREGNVDFENIPVDASDVADNTYTEELEPYDFSELVPFSEEYLKDFLAEKANVPKAEAEKRANERLHHTLEKDFAVTASDYENVLRDFSEYSISNKFSDCNLLPVWLLNIPYKGKLYRYAVNGQTGKVVGEIPISLKKRNIYFAGAFGVSLITIAILTFLTLFLLNTGGIIFQSPALFISFMLPITSCITAFIATNLKLRTKKAPTGDNLASGYVDKSDYKLIKKRDRFLYAEHYTLPATKTYAKFVAWFGGWDNFSLKDKKNRRR